MPYIITATNFGVSKESAYSESNTSSSSGSSQTFGIISNNNMVDISKSRADGGKTTVDAVEASAGDDSVTVLVYNGTSGHYFDDRIIPSLNHGLLN